MSVTLCHDAVKSYVFRLGLDVAREPYSSGSIRLSGGALIVVYDMGKGRGGGGGPWAREGG